MQDQAMHIPMSLKPYFQEYDLEGLNIQRDADLIILRILEFGNWTEIRWLFQVYPRERIRRFLREHGERWLKPVTFNYWRLLMGVRKWKSAPFEKVMIWFP
jgi:hypothetical protein